MSLDHVLDIAVSPRELFRWFDRHLDTLGSLATIASVVLVLAGAGYAFATSTARIQTWRLVNRRGVLRKALNGVGFNQERSRFRAATYALYRNRVRLGEQSVREELSWLASLVGGLGEESHRHPLASRKVVPVPFAFATERTRYAATLDALGDAYATYAADLRRRWVLRSSAGPMIEEEYRVAQDTARELRALACFEPVADPPDPGGLRGAWVSLASQLDGFGTLHPRRVQLVAWPYATGARGALTFATIGVSFQEFRVSTGSSAGHRLVEVGGQPQELVVVDTKEQEPNPFEFDSVLTRYHGPGFRVESDRTTGRQKLHLCISETRFFAWRATQSPAGAEGSKENALAARLLSLNLLCVDDDDRVLLVQRGGYSVYPGKYAGTVTGNCELAERDAHPADLDAHKLPDPISAIAREAAEEIGVDLRTPRSELRPLGLIQVESESELGTHVLVATARLPVACADFRVDPAAIDRDEGSWELGEHALVVDLPAAAKDASSAQEFVHWLRTSTDLTTHAAGSLLLLLVARREVELRMAERSDQVTPVPALVAESWTLRQLAGWLAEDARAPSSCDYVRRQPLIQGVGTTGGERLPYASGKSGGCPRFQPDR